MCLLMKILLSILVTYVLSYVCVQFKYDGAIIIQMIVSGLLFGWYFSKLKLNQYAVHLFIFLLISIFLNYLYSLITTKPIIKIENFLIGLSILQMGIFFISFLIIKIDAHIKNRIKRV